MTIGQKKAELHVLYDQLRHDVRTDTYEYARTQPILSLKIKDISHIDSVYIRFAAIASTCDFFHVDAASFDNDTKNQIKALKSTCDAAIRHIGPKISRLDKKLLLKDAGSGTRKCLEKYCFKNPSSV